jgi:hypothetical protein
MKESETVGLTILNQLGGRRFSKMTGAQSFVAHSDGLSFRFPRSRGVNFLRITLTPADTYDLTFYSVRGIAHQEKKVLTDVYAEQLQEIFTSVTGLRTSLGAAPNFCVNTTL